MKNTVEPDKPLMTICRIRFAFRITSATNTHSEYVLLITFPQQKCLHERASLLPYTYITCLVLLQYQYLRRVLT